MSAIEDEAPEFAAAFAFYGAIGFLVWVCDCVPGTCFVFCFCFVFAVFPCCCSGLPDKKPSKQKKFGVVVPSAPPPIWDLGTAEIP